MSKHYSRCFFHFKALKMMNDFDNGAFSICCSTTMNFVHIGFILVSYWTLYFDDRLIIFATLDRATINRLMTTVISPRSLRRIKSNVDRNACMCVCVCVCVCVCMYMLCICSQGDSCVTVLSAE